MTFPADLQHREAALLATASQHRTPLARGELCWQHWSDPDAGPPLILLHGGFGSWNHWFANIHELRRRRDLWTVDLPGLGNSGRMPRTAKPADFAAALQSGVRQLLGDRDYELGGFSFGAMVGARLAADEHCRRFTAIGAAGCGALHVQVPLKTPPSQETPWSEAALVHRANLRALMFGPGKDIDDLAVYLHATNLARARFNSRALSMTDDFLLALPAISGQLLTVWGGEDATVGGPVALRARREIIEDARPDSAFHVLESVGHWAMYEAPEAINALLTR